MKFQLKYARQTPSQNADLLRLHPRDSQNTFLSQTHPSFVFYSTLFCKFLPHYSKPTFLPIPVALPSFSLSAISELSNRKNAAAAAHQDFFPFHSVIFAVGAVNPPGPFFAMGRSRSRSRTPKKHKSKHRKRSSKSRSSSHSKHESSSSRYDKYSSSKERSSKSR